MAEKCALCGEKLEEGFADKIAGTVVKIKDKGKENKNKLYYICSDCQKKHGNKIKEEVEKKAK